MESKNEDFMKDLEKIVKSLPTSNEEIKQTKQITLDYCFIRSEIIQELLTMHMLGMSVVDISGYFGMGENEVNSILDRYTQYL